MLGRRSVNDFEDEIRSHLELETERLKALGMTEEQARREARRHFGNVGVAEDRFYHGRRFVSIDDTVRDLRHAARGLLRSRGFLVTAVGTLALAIGAVSGMFGVVNTVLFAPLPYSKPDQLYMLLGRAPGTDLPDTVYLGNEFYIHYKENSKVIDGIFNFGNGTSTLRANERVERIPMAWPTNGMYATFGVKPQIGRLPVAEDNDDAVLISDSLWTTWFNRDPKVIGKWYFVSDSMKQVIGVMPPEFKFPSDRTMLWVSGDIPPTNIRPGNFGTPLIARVKDGVTEAQLVAELNGLAKQLPGRFGGSPTYNKVITQFQALPVPLKDWQVGPTLRTSLLILLGGVALVLVIACANVANLFLVRAETRRRDIIVRRAIGASRAQLVRFQMAEAFVVAGIAGVLAIILSAVTLPAFIKAAPEGIPRLGEAGIDPMLIAATFVIAVLVALVCGAAPALRASSPDLTGLRESGRGSIGGRRWGRDMLVVGQTALALVMLIGSALLVQSFKRLRSVDPGYETKDIYTFQFAPQQPSLNDGPSFGQMHLAMMDKIRALPGVSMVGVVNNVPLDEGTGGVRAFPDGAANGDGVLLRLNFAGGDYFKAIGMKVLAGRTFTNSEAITPNRNVIISKAASEKMWPGQNPLGRLMRPRFGNQDSISFTVIGVVNDVKQLDFRTDAEPVVYMPLTGPTPQAWAMGSPAYVVKTTRGDLLKPDIRRLVKEIAPEAPVYREFTMEFLARRYMLQLSFTTLTLGVLAALALMLGAIGLYGVLSYVVAQRTREIGVRMALGATASAVRSQVVRQGTTVVMLGALIGVVIAYWSTKYLASLLFGVKPVDAMTFGAMSAMMIAMGVLASYVPARRASNVDPMEALRSD